MLLVVPGMFQFHSTEDNLSKVKINKIKFTLNKLRGYHRIKLERRWEIMTNQKGPKEVQISY